MHHNKTKSIGGHQTSKNAHMGLGANIGNTKLFIWALINLHMIDEESETKINLLMRTIPLTKENKKKNTKGWTCYSKLHKGFERLILNTFQAS